MTSSKNTASQDDLTTLLLNTELVSSKQEAECVAISIMEDVASSSLSLPAACVLSFQDYFSLEEKEAGRVVSKLFPAESRNYGSDSIHAEDDEGAIELGSDDEDGAVIGEGECELCERDQILLTKHHLIPKSTWPRMHTTLSNAAASFSNKDRRRAQLILGEGLSHLTELLEHEPTRADMKKILQFTCSICRPCHSAIHRTHDNLTLAREYSTIGNLLKDERIFKFCKWANKQRAGKYGR